MQALIAIAVLSVLFTLFALLGPAEKYRPCRGVEPGEKRCGGCLLGTGEKAAGAGCPGKNPVEG